MNANEVATQIEKLNALIEEKEADLAHKVNRCRELSAKETPNTAMKQRFIARIKTEIHQLTDEINNHKTELWGLQELNLPGV
jgi:predicted RNase H-like nuclease (RuvC/YqgF family)